jgi:hypothetical protein
VPLAVQTLPLAHALPAGAAAPVSTQLAAPVVHLVTPRWQLLAGTHEAPSAHAAHAPALQTLPLPHGVPSGTFVVESWQTCAPVAQEVVPAWHGFTLGVQLTPSAQPRHTPARQTLPVPHAVPSAAATPVSTHVSDPAAAVGLAQVVSPCRQLPGMVHATAARQTAVQAPAMHAWPTPHAVPSESGVRSSTQPRSAVLHVTWPAWHGLVG